MKRAYQNRYGVTSEVLIHGVKQGLWHDGVAREKDSNSFVLGMAGNSYAGYEWRALLQALSSVQWRLADRDIRIVVGY